jgi:L-2,4-diaminobutyrate transaminase
MADASPQFGPVMHGFTYSGHPVGASLGLVNIDIMERDRLVEQAAEVGPYFLKILRDRIADHPFVGDVRGAGQMIAAEFVADKGKKRFFDPKVGAHRVVAAKAFEHGVLSRALPYLEATSFSPPLSMTKAEADEAAERYAKALAACTDELTRLAKAVG